MTFIQELRQQRWDDHRFYHHNRINQFLHLLSALCFLCSYMLIFIQPVYAIMVGWILAMLLRQAGHFFFEPLTYDEVNQASQEYKESIKVGYNLRRKLVLLSIWIIAPLMLFFTPSFFGLLDTPQTTYQHIHNTAIVWLFIGAGAVIFRTVHLFFILGVQSGLVWFSKILTDPFHDVLIYYKAPYYIVRGEMYDEMTDWYDSSLLQRS
jgi:hypothetical protein